MAWQSKSGELDLKRTIKRYKEDSGLPKVHLLRAYVLGLGGTWLWVI